MADTISGNTFVYTFQRRSGECCRHSKSGMDRGFMYFAVHLLGCGRLVYFLHDYFTPNVDIPVHSDVRFAMLSSFLGSIMCVHLWQSIYIHIERTKNILICSRNKRRNLNSVNYIQWYRNRKMHKNLEIHQNLDRFNSVGRDPKCIHILLFSFFFFLRKTIICFSSPFNFLCIVWSLWRVTWKSATYLLFEFIQALKIPSLKKINECITVCIYNTKRFDKMDV